MNNPNQIDQNAIELTQMLNNYAAGNESDFDRVIEAVYAQLNQMAMIQINKINQNITMNANDLVHETYLKLKACAQFKVSNRQHFMALAATAMRHLILDRLKYKGRQKHGGLLVVTVMTDNKLPIEDNRIEIMAVNDSLELLRSIKPELAQTVECRYFAGYSEAETAEILKVSERTVRRYWVTAKNIIKKQVV
jgi:RNA polymerase sigma factor (TIGR02999 family)